MVYFMPIMLYCKALSNLSRTLDISNNASVHYNRIHLSILTGLHAIELANNPWSCDCRLRPLKHWLVSNNVPHSVDPQCHSPPRLAGRPFSNLQVDEFACPPELLSAPRYVEANAGKVTKSSATHLTVESVGFRNTFCIGNS